MAKGRAVLFYFNDWAQDEFVQSLSALQTGIYWKLLVYQASEDSLPSTLEEIARDVKLDLADLTREWAILGAKFLPGPDGRLRNRKMESAMRASDKIREELDQHRKTEKARRAAAEFSEARRGYYISDSAMEEILMAFPKREGNPRDGFQKAMVKIREIVKSDQDVEVLMGAIRSYDEHLKKHYQTQKERLQYTKRIDRWLEESWTDWISKKPEAKEQVPVEIPEFKTLDEELSWKRKQGLLHRFPPGTRFPWEPRYDAKPYEIEAIRKHWTDDKKREAVS